MAASGTLGEKSNANNILVKNLKEKCHVGHLTAEGSKVQEVGRIELAHDKLYALCASLVKLSDLKQSYVVQ